MKNRNLTLIFVLAALLAGAQTIQPKYLFGGINLARSGLHGINRWVDGYNQDPNKIGGWIMDENLTKIHGLTGIAFGAGIGIDEGIFDFTYSKRQGSNLAHYSILEDSEFKLRYKTRTLGFGYLTPLANSSSKLKTYFGVHLDFSSGSLTTIFSAWYTDWLHMDYYKNFAITPSLQVFYYPFSKIVYFGARGYWQMNMKKNDFSVLDREIVGNWPDDKDPKKMKSSGGNIGIMFQVFVNPFRIKLPKKIDDIEDEPLLTDVKLSGVVRDNETNKPIGEAVVKIEKFENGDYVEIISFKTYNEQGYYEIELPRNCKYRISTDAFGYENKNEIFELNDYSPTDYSKDFNLLKMKTGQAITLKNIYFKKASAELLSESFPELDKLFRFLDNNKKVEIEIAGHTSDEGTDEYNLKLSQNRAQSIVDYLKKKGISADRMKPVGYGEKFPVGDNTTEEGRILNRRVEFKILKQ
jgi:outer membrane protein OmpA-like peptidoglycan-associated protein